MMDNYAARKKVQVRDWLAANPRDPRPLHPDSGSWLNLVEIRFGIIEGQAIHRETFTSVKDLNAKIRSFVDGWNGRCHPFVDQDRRPDPQESQLSHHSKPEALVGALNAGPRQPD